MRAKQLDGVAGSVSRLVLSPEQRQQWAALAGMDTKGTARAPQLKGTSPHTQEHRLNQVLKGLRTCT